MIKYLSKTIVLSLIFYCYSCSNNDNVSIQTKEIQISTIDSINIRQSLTELERRLINMGLINLEEFLPEIIIDLKYSTEDNFFGFNAYGDFNKAYLQVEAAEKLKNALDILQIELPGHTFIVYDAARPRSVQQIMWDSIQQPESRKHWYVARPDRGSIHNFGMAVDLSIADTNGNALDMGTEFDYFGEVAFPRYTQKYLENGILNQQQVDNRLLLISIMERAGFSVSRTEWWHFNASSLARAKEKYEIIE
jgi:zinc D-Ala-D-Ala dipeptidase